jgi:hypothetical protein
MLEALGDDAEGERLDASDCLVSVLTVGAMTPDKAGTSASQRPSSSRSISIVNVTTAMYHPNRLSPKKAMDLTVREPLSRLAHRRSSPGRWPAEQRAIRPGSCRVIVTYLEKV